MENLITVHPEIPQGDYCYHGLDVIDEALKEQPCPHWSKTAKGAQCAVISEEHHDGCTDHLLWDKVKECGHNPGTAKAKSGKQVGVGCGCDKL